MGGPHALSITGSDVAITHELALWGLKPAREYSWRVFAAAALVSGGTLQAAALLAGVAGIAFDVTGDDPVVEHLMFTFRCDERYLLIVDADGEVVWYQEIDSPAGGLPCSGTSL